MHTWYRTNVIHNPELQRTEQAAAAGQEGKYWGACSAPVCYTAASLHPTTLKTSEDFLQRLTHHHNSIFALDFVLLNAAKWSSCIQCSSCPNSQWEKRYKHWKTFWQLPAPLTGLHSTRKNHQLFPGCITAKITTVKCGGTIHTTIQPCHKTNSTITWSKLLKTSNRISRNWD